jgi:hypothetical protein
MKGSSFLRTQESSAVQVRYVLDSRVRGNDGKTTGMTVKRWE